MDIPDDLTPKQHAALEALLTELTATKAADKAGVAVRSIYEWLRNDEAFKRAYRSARRVAVEQAATALQRVSVPAVEVLLSSLNSTNESIALRAALAVLDMAFRGLELFELVDDVADLKREREEREAGRT